MTIKNILEHNSTIRKEYGQLQNQLEAKLAQTINPCEYCEDCTADNLMMCINQCQKNCYCYFEMKEAKDE